MIATHCAMCGRALKDPKSVATGIGPICLRKMMSRGQDAAGAENPFANGLLQIQPLFPNISMSHAGDGHVLTNVPHLVVHHSPTGFEFGYGGSGPADLALNICEALLRQRGYKGEKVKCYKGKCLRMAWDLHFPFRDQFLAGMPREGGNIPYDVAQEWITQRMQQILLRDGAYA